jgi:DNA invertase Pin-like site-specific DNA recombinase
MLIGYARVSTSDQNLDLQLNALRAAGAEQIITDEASGSRVDRPGLRDLFKVLRAGDTLVVWKLDRLSRSLRDLLDLINQLQGRDVGFQSLTEKIDTTTAGGKLIFHVIGALAEFERGMIVERTNAGLDAARKRGVKLGRGIQRPSFGLTSTGLARRQSSSQCRTAVTLGRKAVGGVTLGSKAVGGVTLGRKQLAACTCRAMKQMLTRLRLRQWRCPDRDHAPPLRAGSRLEIGWRYGDELHRSDEIRLCR